MNERIKQIEEQCYIKPGGYYPGSDYPEPFFDMQMFAELIVQECMSVIGEENYDMLTGKANCTKIKRHFGIEE